VCVGGGGVRRVCVCVCRGGGCETAADEPAAPVVTRLPCSLQTLPCHAHHVGGCTRRVRTCANQHPHTRPQHKRDRHRDTTELQLISTAPGARVLQRVAANALSNVGPVEFEPHEWYPQMVSFNYLKVRCAGCAAACWVTSHPGCLCVWVERGVSSPAWLAGWLAGPGCHSQTWRQGTPQHTWTPQTHHSTATRGARRNTSRTRRCSGRCWTSA
jgi:hypothetical protein